MPVDVNSEDEDVGAIAPEFAFNIVVGNLEVGDQSPDLAQEVDMTMVSSTYHASLETRAEEHKADSQTSPITQWNFDAELNSSNTSTGQPILQYAEDPPPWTGSITQFQEMQAHENQNFLIDWDMSTAAGNWSFRSSHGGALSVYREQPIAPSPGSSTGPMRTEPVIVDVDGSGFENLGINSNIPGGHVGDQALQPWPVGGLADYSLPQGNGWGTDNPEGSSWYLGRPILPNSLGSAPPETPRTLSRPAPINGRR